MTEYEREGKSAVKHKGIINRNRWLIRCEEWRPEEVREVLCIFSFVSFSFSFFWSRKSLLSGDMRPGFDPWVGKILCRREWLPTPVLYTGEFHGQRRLVGYNLWDHKESDMTERLTLSYFHIHKYTHIYIHTCNGILLIRGKKEWNNTICNNMDGPRNCHTKWNKQKDKYHMTSFTHGI